MKAPDLLAPRSSFLLYQLFTCHKKSGEIEVICAAPGLREQKTSKASDVIRRNKEMKSWNGNAPRGGGINK